MKSRLHQAVEAVLDQAVFDQAAKGFVIDEALYLDLREAFEDLHQRSVVSLEAPSDAFEKRAPGF